MHENKEKFLRDIENEIKRIKEDKKKTIIIFGWVDLESLNTKIYTGFDKGTTFLVLNEFINILIDTVIDRFKDALRRDFYAFQE